VKRKRARKGPQSKRERPQNRIRFLPSKGKPDVDLAVELVAPLVVECARRRVLSDDEIQMSKAIELQDALSRWG
jgi:hypothetical protein